MSSTYSADPIAYQAGTGNILVVDEHRDIINLIQLALEEQPVKVYAAINSREALDQLEARPYDLLLLAAKMSGQNGLEICRLVKNHPLWHTSKIIMISASTNSDNKLRAFEAGADDYVTKPFRVQELKARVQVILKLRMAERDITRRNAQLLELIRVSQRLNARLDLHQTADEVVKSAARLTGADRAYLLLWNPERRCHTITASFNPDQAALATSSTPGQDLSSLIQQAGRLQIISNNQPVESGLELLPVNDCEAAGVPLRVNEQHMGVLIVSIASEERHFAQPDLEILTTLANQASIALENARLYNVLERENEKYRLIAEKASDMIISLDSSGTLIYVNERVQSILGYSPEEMTGKPLEQFLAAEGQTALRKFMRKLLQPHPESAASGFYSQARELLAVTKEGVPRDLEFNFGLLFQAGGQSEIAGIQAIGRDVTARKRSEENERMRMVGQIASGVAHDLNNVLANVIGHAQLLKAETRDPEVHDTIQSIEQSALDGAETVRRIQEFTVQRMQQDLDLLDLNAVVQSTIDLSRPRWKDDAQQKGMRIEVERELGDIPAVRGKGAELREVLINLFNNALDAMTPAGGKVGFRTYLEKTGKMVCLEVWDTGKGMTPEVRHHIFEPFYTTKGLRGTGLGLSVTYGIITRFGGEITVESKINKGTKFCIHLPAVKLTAADREWAFSGPGPGRSSHQATPLFQGRILAIEDEFNLRNIIKRALSMAGFEVEVAAGGFEALAMLEDAAANGRPLQPYDLILSDLGMPEMSGWEVAQQCFRRWPAVPFVLVTGWGEQLDTARLTEYNIKRTLGKPFNIHDLMQLAGSLIHQNNQ